MIMMIKMMMMYVTSSKSLALLETELYPVNPMTFILIDSKSYCSYTLQIDNTIHNKT